MREPTFQDAFSVLCLQAADAGRGSALFGGGLDHVRRTAAPFLVGEAFPEVYLEFPLAGRPFCDVTLLLGNLAPGTRVDSPLAAGTGAVLDFYAKVRSTHADTSCGFELDCGAEQVPLAALHFQPRNHRELVRPFFEALGEPGRADLYLAQSERMPDAWKLAFFGLFRGRPDAPLRVCGYLDPRERAACADDPSHVRSALARAGFAAFDDAMLRQVAATLSHAPGTADFQMDVWPDGSVGSTFGIDLRFDSMPESVLRRYFQGGAGEELMSWLIGLGVADDRAWLLRDISLTRGVPVEMDDGTVRAYGFSLKPGWLKLRWRDGVLCESKMYLAASAGFVKGQA